MQDQMKNMNMRKKPKRKYYCWSCGSNLQYGRNIYPNKKAGQKNDNHYQNRLGGNNKGCE